MKEVYMLTISVMLLLVAAKPSRICIPNGYAQQYPNSSKSICIGDMVKIPTSTPPHPISPQPIPSHPIYPQLIPPISICVDLEEFQCLSTSLCIPKSSVNDGTRDCEDGSDEGYASCESLLDEHSSWNGGWNGTVNITIPKNIPSWRLYFEFTSPLTSFQQWTGVTTNHSNIYSLYNTFYTIYSVDKYNAPMSAGDTLSFEILYGFNVGYKVPTINSIELNGQIMCHSGVCVDLEEFQCLSSGRCVSKGLVNDGTKNCKDGSDEGYDECESLLDEHSSWNEGWNGTVNIPIQRNISSWRLTFEFDSPLTSFQQWTGVTTNHNNSIYFIDKYNAPMSAGDTLSFEILYRFNVGYKVPTIKSIELNGKIVCHRIQIVWTTTPAVFDDFGCFPWCPTCYLNIDCECVWNDFACPEGRKR